MIELTPNQVRCNLLGPFDMDDAEHFGYYDELFALDFKKKEDAVYAITKWLKPMIDDEAIKWPIFYEKEKEGLRRLITLNKMPAGRHSVPGFEFADGMTMEEYPKHTANFLRWLWETLYEEPFVPADLSQYRLRIDKPFRDNPTNPELWGNEPKYLSWEDWDLMHQGKMKWYE